MTLEELDKYLVPGKNKEQFDYFQLIKFDLIETVEHSMNLGHVYKVVFKAGDHLFMNEIELNYDIDSEVYEDYVSDQGDEFDFDFFPAEEITVIDYQIKKI